MRRLAERLRLALLLAAFTGCATIGNPPPGPEDPGFAGTWAVDDVEIVIGHTAGALHVIAFNERRGARWGAFDATGSVTEVGRATVSGDLWRRVIEGQRRSLGSVDATLVRSADMLDVVMQYSIGLTPRNERITLVRQPVP